jgi:hypothetical protein
MCRSHGWFPGYETKDELMRHMALHRCQWLVCVSKNSEVTPDLTNGLPPALTFKVCDYLPKDEADLLRHVDQHLERDVIPYLV